MDVVGLLRTETRLQESVKILSADGVREWSVGIWVFFQISSDDFQLFREQVFFARNPMVRLHKPLSGSWGT